MQKKPHIYKKKDQWKYKKARWEGTDAIVENAMCHWFTDYLNHANVEPWLNVMESKMRYKHAFSEPLAKMKEREISV